MAAAAPPPAGTRHALVIPRTASLVVDFAQEGTWMAAYFHLSPHGLSDLLTKRKRPLTLKQWGRMLLRRRDPRFRKNRTFLCCVCALIFRRDAIKTPAGKLTGRVSSFSLPLVYLFQVSEMQHPFLHIGRHQLLNVPISLSRASSVVGCRGEVGVTPQTLGRVRIRGGRTRESRFV